MNISSKNIFIFIDKLIISVRNYLKAGESRKSDVVKPMLGIIRSEWKILRIIIYFRIIPQKNCVRNFLYFNKTKYFFSHPN